MEFRPLASSSGGCAYLVTAGGAPPLLIDCGIRYAQLREAMDFKVHTLAGCVVSHSHGDHTKGVEKLLKAGVDVYASTDTWRALGPSLFESHRAQVIIDQQPFEIGRRGEWQVLPFSVIHDVPTFGFLVQHGTEKLLYLTDTAWCPHRFQGLTVMAVEANWSEEILRQNTARGHIDPERFRRTAGSHMSLERLLRMLRANDLSTVREIHLLHLSDANSDEREFKEAVQKATGIPTYIAAKQEAAHA